MSNENKVSHISLSGGSTPKLLFTLLSEHSYATKINWGSLHFWWGDERCVKPSDAESNYGEAKELLFDHINIAAENIHRIIGENDPKQEIIRYAAEMRESIPSLNGLPEFDWIILGVGNDGHTASLFPSQIDYNDAHLTTIATQPETGQLRISKTARLIENSKRITYLVLGKNKAATIKKINEITSGSVYPAANISSKNGSTLWYLDAESAEFIE